MLAPARSGRPRAILPNLPPAVAPFRGGVRLPAPAPGTPTATAVRHATRTIDDAAKRAHRGALPRRVALARGRVATGVALAGLAGFGGIFATVRARRSEAFDLAVMLRLQRRRRPWLDRVMAAVSWPGFPPQSRLIPPAAVATLWILRFRTEAAFLTAAWGTGALSSVLKRMMDRPRPVAGTDLRVVTAPLGGSSFPSGHVITFVGTYGFLAYLTHTLVADAATRRLATGGLVGLVLLVGPSRIYEGHHWPTDVSASYLLGTSYLIVVVAGYRRVKAGEAGPAGRLLDAALGGGWKPRPVVRRSGR
jgi:membrane-associated phospholipid phosphatase